APSGRRVAFSIGHDPAKAPTAESDGTMSGRTGATCIACTTAVPTSHIKTEGAAGRMGAALMAVVAEGRRRRIYLPPTQDQLSAAAVEAPRDVPDGSLPDDPRNFWTPAYGLTEFRDLFTNRQLVALTTFSDLVSEAREEVLRVARAAGLPDGERLEAGGDGAAAYADAVATYLALVESRLSDYQSSITTWASNPQMEILRNVFARQAIPMAWDFAEGNPFGPSSGTFDIMLAAVTRAVELLPSSGAPLVGQADAAVRDYDGLLVCTDPPYYDNIGYSDLSDFFYVWLRRSLREVHPVLLSTMLVPKAEELVANPYRHGGKEGASEFFEEGFRHVFARARESARDDYPITVYYAFKQAELESEGVASTGWATLLEGMITSGWAITATWPVRSERSGRMIAVGTNALASSIVLALRPRHDTAQATTRRGFIAALKATLPQALTEMQQGAIAPVDLAQATIGPGMAVFSSYASVIESDGSAMSVKTALALINQALDEVLAEQDGDLDPDTRFCVDWYRQFGWTAQLFGEADVLARAKNTSVEGLARGGVLTSAAGKVQLVRPDKLDPAWNPADDDRVSLWEATLHLARSYATEGGETTARLMSAVGHRVDLDAVQLLAYRLYELSQSDRPADALLFNGLGTGWSALTAAARRTQPAATQGTFDLDGES
ncbi:DUF1156 domain-containing protein, partial [Miniimonas arenae]|uniref:DUF1156 domain-containing protein n=1 Tax=Miniimonas arenae TaxID=676201 RepID=UPI0028A8695F